MTAAPDTWREIAGIRASETTLQERHRGRVQVSLSRVDVDRLELARGPRAERPWLEGLLGGVVTLAALGYLGRAVVAVFTDEDVMHSALKFAAGMPLVAALGGAMLFRAVVPADLVYVHMRNGSVRTLSFERRCAQADRDAFAAALRELRWPVQ